VERKKMNEPVNIYPRDNPDNFVWVSWVIGEEVAIVVPYPIQAQLMVAAASSDPKLIVLEGDDRLAVKTGWTYTGGQFIPPSE
jgi:hypothetical protein